jgi:5-methylthioadenosine/S-adenosylhomocysteine deaminase
MVTVGALECIRSGTTTVVQNAGGIARSAAALAQTGLRCVFAESIRDRENGSGPISPEKLARDPAPKFSPKLRDEGMQHISALFTTWHGAKQGRIARADAQLCATSPRNTISDTRST